MPPSRRLWGSYEVVVLWRDEFWVAGSAAHLCPSLRFSFVFVYFAYLLVLINQYLNCELDFVGHATMCVFSPFPKTFVFPMMPALRWEDPDPGVGRSCHVELILYSLDNSSCRRLVACAHLCAFPAISGRGEGGRGRVCTYDVWIWGGRSVSLRSTGHSWPVGISHHTRDQDRTTER